ncbi:MAG: RDD family protein [Rhodospirillales bacterium]|nr:RDD family protein [Rhodospirillales bacterium]MDE2200820.1 RDD family protein [Rhodospirillales bacterium]MDE2575242.1 RDD family protein [Rhodospirillales bacterium]
MIFTPNQAGLALLQDDLLTRGVISRRIFAWFLDLLLVAMLCSAVWSFCLVFGVLTLGFGFPLFGVLPFIPLLYTWLFVASPLTATPGQALLGLRVRRNDDLGRPTPLQALAYALLFYATIALGWFWLAVTLVSVRHRAFHDMLADLVVIRARALHTPLTPPPAFWNMPSGTAPPGGTAAA